nr:hypothetical protein [Polyangiaceae bacterium]
MKHATLFGAERAHSRPRGGRARGLHARRHFATLASVGALAAGVCLWSSPAAAESTLGVDLS